MAGGAGMLAVDLGGHVYVTGTSAGDGTRDDFATVSYGPDGTERWAARYDAPGHLPDGPVGLAVDPAGRVYVAGTAYFTSSGAEPDYTVLQYGPNGSERWLARLNNSEGQWAAPMAFALDAAGTAYVTGRSPGADGDAITTLALSREGTQQWVARYSSPGPGTAFGGMVAAGRTGQVVVTGRECRNAACYSVTIGYDAAGREQWIVRDSAYVASQALDGAGNVYLLRRDAVLLKYAPDGRRLWRTSLSAAGAALNADNLTLPNAQALALDGAGAVYVLWANGGRTTTMKYDAAGERLWAARLDGWTASHLAVDVYGSVYLGGTHRGVGWSTYALAKYVQEDLSAPASEDYALAQNYPNPFTHTTTFRYTLPEAGHVTLKVYDLLGRKVDTVIDGAQMAGVHDVDWSAARLPAGLYVYRLQCDRSFSARGKLVLVK